MALWQWFKKKNVQLSAVSAGRVSIEPVSQFLPKSLEIKYRFVNSRYPREWLYVIEKSVIANPNLSQMFELIIDLANTGHNVEVISNSEEAKKEIDIFAEKLNADSLVNQLLAQIALYGAISIEIVVNERLDGINKIVRVPATTIYFTYNEETDTFEPYQQVGSLDPIKLNPETYIYEPLLTMDGSPYAMPPFIAALSSVEVQEELLTQLKGIAKKLGLIGFLDVEFPQLQRSPNETEFEYQKRLTEYLNNIAQSISENMAKGVFLHFEGTKAQFKEVGGSMSGARDVIEMNEQWIISGAKGQPSLLGRTTGSTETWATIAYEQFVRMLQNYQRLVRRVMERLYKFHLTLKGYSFEDVNFIFNPLPQLKPDAEIEMFAKKSQAVALLLQSGIIDIEKAKEIMEVE
ncbi:hypothetical protein [Thermodesulfovibrio thiophilus]|uniref:hypothetical protein n=1 Tax=Thermodesulfovibrio thiophilus TaxID=340095 RepID=UPI0003F5487F|nr:hypothetical protein [Thermodesulfovibrio thiophilus]